MCINPGEVVTKSGEYVKIGCGTCWQCCREKVHDWGGRCVAESMVSSNSYSVTLTYAGDGPESKTLVYSDVQKFLKRLRFDGYKVRYACSGEYGTEKGRAHWHIILFFKHKFPDVPLKRRINWKYWPHGFVHFQTPDFGGFAYALKYILKDRFKKEGHFSMSKKPPLGDEYLTGTLVHRYVEAGLAPVDFKYSWPDVTTKRGKPLVFNMTGATRRNFVDAYIKTWKLIRGGDPPYSEALEKELAKNFMQTPEGQELQEFKDELQEADKKKRTARILSRRPSKYKEWKRERDWKKEYYDYIRSRASKTVNVGDRKHTIIFEDLYEEYPIDNDPCPF